LKALTRPVGVFCFAPGFDCCPAAEEQMADGKDAKGKPRIDTLHPRTQAVRGGLRRSDMDETAEALFLTSGFVYGSAEEAEAAFLPGGGGGRFVYSRYGNPTVAMFEERLRLIEGAEACKATASGNGRGVCRPRLSAQVRRPHRLQPRFVRLVPLQSSRTSCRAGASNRCSSTARISRSGKKRWIGRPRWYFSKLRRTPMLEIIDLKAVCELAHKAGAKVVVDNVFATAVAAEAAAARCRQSSSIRRPSTSTARAARWAVPFSAARNSSTTI